MQTYNLQVPPTLSELSGSELEHLIVCASKERGGKSVLAEIFAKRFDTKRKINTMVSVSTKRNLSISITKLHARVVPLTLVVRTSSSQRLGVNSLLYVNDP